MNNIVCIGDLMVDVVALLPSPLHAGSDTPAPITIRGGGSAANTAAWLRTTGTPTSFVGRVGDDAFGRRAVDELRACGTDVQVSVDPDRPTGICLVLVDAAGERTMVPSAGANAALHPPSAELLTDAHLHVSAYAVFLDGARPAVDVAIQHGAPISIDAASVAPLRAFGAEAFLAWLPACLLFANRDEAVLLGGTDDPADAARRLGAHCGEAIVKLGAGGAVWSDGERTVVVESRPMPVVDSTGAGDAFAAGVLAARLAGEDVESCLRSGNELAARAVGLVGGRPPAQPGV